MGNVPPADVPLWINAANAVLVPSQAEGFGLSVIEALACGVPPFGDAGRDPSGRARRGSRARTARPGTARPGEPRWSPVLEADDPRVDGRARAAIFSADRMAARVVEAWRDVAAGRAELSAVARQRAVSMRFATRVTATVYSNVRGERRSFALAKYERPAATPDTPRPRDRRREPAPHGRVLRAGRRACRDPRRGGRRAARAAAATQADRCCPGPASQAAVRRRPLPHERRRTSGEPAPVSPPEQPTTAGRGRRADHDARRGCRPERPTTPASRPTSRSGPRRRPPSPRSPRGARPARRRRSRRARRRPPASARRGKLRRRLRYLRHVRELLLRDLGGFTYEIHRTAGGTAQEPQRRLAAAKAERISALDAEVLALESRLGEPHAETLLREPGIGGTCHECGELHASDAHFCSRCGAPLDEQGARPAPRPPQPADDRLARGGRAAAGQRPLGGRPAPARPPPRPTRRRRSRPRR